MSDALNIKKFYDIFISYNQRSSSEVVQQIVSKLENEQEKFKIWLDRNEMNAGVEHYKKMEEGLRQSKMVLCFINKEYCESQNCTSEASFANELNLKRIFVVLEPDLSKQNLNGIGILMAGNLRLNAYKAPNTFKPWSEDLYNKLVSSIRALLNGSPLPVELVHLQ